MRAWVAPTLLALASSTLGACGGASVPAATPSPDPAPARPGVELTLRTPSGEWIHLGDLRGRPVLLVFLATYDGVSQAALTPIRRLLLARDDVQVVGVMHQQEADTLVDAWVHALDPPFPVGYDADGMLAEGETALGTIDAVPTFVALDANGVEVERRVGFQGERALSQMVDAAVAHAPLGRREPPPLLGQPAGR